MRRNGFLHLNFNWLCKLGKHPLSFSQGQLDPGCPTKAHLTVTDEAVCRVRGEMEVSEEEEGKVGLPLWDGCHPQEKL